MTGLRLAEVDSTQRIAAELVRAGDRTYRYVLADHQTAGRGRRGAIWHSRPGSSFCASFMLWKPFEPRVLLAAWAALVAAEKLPLADVRLKFPNDLMLMERKLGGCLVEMCGETAIVGVGINLRIGACPPDLGVSLEEAGAFVDPVELAEAIADGLEAADKDWIERWRARDCSAGRRYRGQETGQEGVALGVDEALRLVIQADDGQVVSTHLAEGTIDR